MGSRRLSSLQSVSGQSPKVLIHFRHYEPRLGDQAAGTVRTSEAAQKGRAGEAKPEPLMRLRTLRHASRRRWCRGRVGGCLRLLRGLGPGGFIRFRGMVQENDCRVHAIRCRIARRALQHDFRISPEEHDARSGCAAPGHSTHAFHALLHLLHMCHVPCRFVIAASRPRLGLRASAGRRGAGPILEPRAVTGPLRNPPRPLRFLAFGRRLGRPGEKRLPAN